MVREPDSVVKTIVVGSFEDFFAREAGGIQRSLGLTLGDVELAADATAEAMAKAFARWDTVSMYASPSGWVYRVGANWAYKRLKRRRVESGQLARFAASKAAGHPQDQSLIHLADVLEGLSREHREVVILRHVLCLSTSETAEILGIAPGTVQSRLSRARAELSHKLTNTPEGRDPYGNAR